MPQMRYSGFRRALLSTLRNYLAENWSKAFACVRLATAPVFLVWGRTDRDVPFSLSREALAAIPEPDFYRRTMRLMCRSWNSRRW
jgi:pimeloyl-ACP methyl ester carboxylesterase